MKLPQQWALTPVLPGALHTALALYAPLESPAGSVVSGEILRVLLLILLSSQYILVATGVVLARGSTLNMRRPGFTVSTSSATKWNSPTLTVSRTL